MNLKDCIPGQEMEIIKVTDLDLELRLLEFGLDAGTKIKIIGKAPLGCPLILETDRMRLSLRRVEASQIKVKASNA